MAGASGAERRAGRVGWGGGGEAGVEARAAAGRGGASEGEGRWEGRSSPGRCFGCESVIRAAQRGCLPSRTIAPRIDGTAASVRPCAKDAYRAVMRRSARGIEIPIFFVMWSDGINSRHLCIVFASEIVGWLFKDAAIARTWVPDVM